MRLPVSVVSCVLLGLAAGAVPPRAQGESDKHRLNPDAAQRDSLARKSERAFKGKEREVIQGYFQANPSAAKRLPPGLAKKKKLPPGWQKKLARGEVVPDDVWRHRVPLPADVVRQLPPAPPGTVVVRIDDKVVRVIETTREVLDILGLPSL